jgi:uncharacterized protein (TIGR02646 family)
VRPIAKRPAPQEFATWLASGNENWQPSYGDLRRPLTDTVRHALLTEQGRVCCYCEQRIGPVVDSDVEHHIEHLVPQSVDPARALDYGNLLASCTNRAHCGDKRSNIELPVHPLQVDCSEALEFGSDGSVGARAAMRPAAAERAVSVLGLDCEPLRERRRSAVAAFLRVVDLIPVGDWCRMAGALMEADEDGNFVPHATAVGRVVNRLAGA